MKKYLFWTFIICWASGVSLTIAHIHGFHLVNFQNEKVNESLIIPKIEESWGMIHLLAEECGCSQTVAEYLIERGKLKGTSEKVILVGSSTQYSSRLTDLGFEIVEANYLDGYIDGVPMLIIHNKKGEVKYSGGYANGMITPVTKIVDLKLLAQVKNNIKSKDLIVMGCAVSKEIQKELDPMGLKYN
ncbi:MAG: hypothetical protein ACJAS4_002507 [Bacteriovoracaceae bacterium]|jgi:hypothetical protein